MRVRVRVRVCEREFDTERVRARIRVSLWGYLGAVVHILAVDVVPESRVHRALRAGAAPIHLQSLKLGFRVHDTEP